MTTHRGEVLFYIGEETAESEQRSVLRMGLKESTVNKHEYFRYGGEILFFVYILLSLQTQREVRRVKQCTKKDQENDI